jgi:hypothetical protein
MSENGANYFKEVALSRTTSDANRSDRDPQSLMVCRAWGLLGEMSPGPADLGLHNRPDIKLKPHLSIITPRTILPNKRRPYKNLD